MCAGWTGQNVVGLRGVLRTFVGHLYYVGTSIFGVSRCLIQTSAGRSISLLRYRHIKHYFSRYSLFTFFFSLNILIYLKGLSVRRINSPKFWKLGKRFFPEFPCWALHSSKLWKLYKLNEKEYCNNLSTLSPYISKISGLNCRIFGKSPDVNAEFSKQNRI